MKSIPFKRLWFSDPAQFARLFKEYGRICLFLASVAAFMVVIVGQALFALDVSAMEVFHAEWLQLLTWVSAMMLGVSMACFVLARMAMNRLQAVDTSTLDTSKE